MWVTDLDVEEILIGRPLLKFIELNLDKAQKKVMQHGGNVHVAKAVIDARNTEGQ